MLILGGVHFVAGWKRAGHLAFPLSLSLLLVPFPGVHHLTNYVWQPTHRLAEQLFALLGGRQYISDHGSFEFLIPVLLTAFVMAKCCHRTGWGRFLVVGLALPVAFVTEAVRTALMGRLWEMDLNLHRIPFLDEMELLLMLLLSGACFFLACRLTGGMRRANQTKCSPPAQLPPQL